MVYSLLEQFLVAFLMNSMENIMRYFIVLVMLFSSLAQADRIKDLVSVSGVRSNQLIGYGLVVGLDGTGDKAPFTTQSFRNMMSEFGVTIPNGVDPKLKNVAAVSITADLPAFAKPGQKLDITVSSIGNSKSLRGGTLLFSPLKAADGQVYAVAQGNLVVGGFGIEGADGSSITINVPSVGRIPNGASVERTVTNSFHRGDNLVLNLNQSDFTTAKRVTDRINKLLGPQSAYAVDATSIRVSAPRDASQRVSFLSVIENLEVDPADTSAKVIINSRTGTIVMGQHVRIKPVAVSHGNLTVTVTEGVQVSQPNALSNGKTVVAADTGIQVEEDNSRMFIFGPSVTLSQIVQAVNQVGAAPGDLMAILEALKQSGALQAELIVI
jgi:flagellar P-ring protein precursor FlgI